ncbi:MAG: putative glutamine amidotransferase domain protein [Nocardioides sp.]|nr:putative glutamine amidotransferase domain protein [Nocardioides sp.]
MCRLFGLHAGPTPVLATFWLVDAPDSLARQSRRNPDGAGIGTFDVTGLPVVDKQPLAAWQDPEFASAARELRSPTFLAHVRYASTGNLSERNTHPFVQDGRLFAHNGVVQGLDELDARLETLGAARLVRGETDSERVFALITTETARHDGDVTEGLKAAVAWISDHLPVYSLNLLLTTAGDLWALRYPETHGLYVLTRPSGGGPTDALDARTSRIHARSEHLAVRASVIIASEPMDADPGWRLLEPGELLHVASDLAVATGRPFPEPPRRLLTRADLDPATEASQHPDPPSR